MIKIKNKILGLVLRCLLGALFIFSGITKLFPIHLTELNLVYNHITNWTYSPYMARILIISEVVIGLALIFGIYLKKITIRAALTLTVIFSVYLMVLLVNDGNNHNCGCFGNVLPMTSLESLIKNIFIILLLLYLGKISELKNIKLSNLFFILSSVSACFLILFLFPIYTWLNVDATPQKTVPFDFTTQIVFNNDASINLKDGKKIIGVFNMSCDNCREVAFKFGILAKQNKLNNIYLLIVGDADEISKFLDETHLNFPFKRYTFFEFVKRYPHSTWPWIIYSEDGVIKKQWIYETFDVKNFIEQLK